MIPEYNTQREQIKLKEYGRNVQKLVNYIRTIPDKDKRTEMSTTLIELIKQLAPTVKEAFENPQRIWDDLYIIADFNFDINSPYPVPNPETVFKKPQTMDYPQSRVRYRHYGKNIEKLIVEAMAKEDAKEREDAVIYLGKLMKTFHGNWNKETIDDSVIIKDIEKMSDGKLTLSLDKVREENLFEKLYREKKKQRNQNDRQRNDRRGGHGKKHHRRRDQ
ncbi:MAG TPA: DUF4290 domain-containing protein [Cyclobacteriaceae bacterium]|nr:DUF4290 domain-containing protein [Cyclobacteriaceae bacterium]